MTTQPENKTPDLSTLGSMPHIEQSTADAKKAIQKKIENLEAEKEKEKDEEDPKLQEQYTFNFDWKDGRGKRWTGEFTNRIINMMDRQTLGALQAQWQLGNAHSAMDPEISGMNYIIAHMSISLKAGRKAEWACDDDGHCDLRKLTSIDLVQALYREVASHEATFHGHRANQASSETSS